MGIGARAPIGNIDGFRVVTPGGQIGWVEEMWLDDEGETTAVAVRLPNAQRGLVIRDDIDEILPEELTIAVRPDARLLELEPPHLSPGAGCTLTASWSASGRALVVPELAPIAPVVRPPASSEPSFFRTVTVLYAGCSSLAARSRVSASSSPTWWRASLTEYATRGRFPSGSREGRPPQP